MSHIEKGVPVPEGVTNNRYQFGEMEVGDSQFFDSPEDAARAQSAAHSWASRNNPDFKVMRRRVKGGYRLWRIE